MDQSPLTVATSLHSFNIMSDGSIVAVEPDVRPEPKPEPIGVHTEQGDDYAVILPDYTMDERPSSLPETNATQPHRPVDMDGRVSPQGKIIVPMDKGNGPLYWQWDVDILGQRNAENMLVDGNGFFDQASLWGFMCSPTACDLMHTENHIVQAGTAYDICETVDFYSQPEKIDGVWHYRGEPISYETHPHLFVTRTNRRATNVKTWITWGGVNNVSDATNGEEHWLAVSNKLAAQPRYKLRHYPSLPRAFKLYRDSLIVDGDLVSLSGGVDMVVDAYKFRGSDTFVREQATGLWFKADEMLKRIGEPYAATAFDYRCYISIDGVTPWMGRVFRSPVPKWQRQG